MKKHLPKLLPILFILFTILMSFWVYKFGANGYIGGPQFTDFDNAHNIFSSFSTDQISAYRYFFITDYF